MQAAGKVKVAIVGGGVCGLSCAIALAKEGVPVDVFEAAAQFGEIGAGIGFGPNAVRVLQDIGILDDVLAKCEEPEINQRSFLFYSGMEGHELIYDYPVQPNDLGLGLHRASFLDALQGAQGMTLTSTHHHKRCTTVIHAEATGRPIIHFEDGTTHEADVVLGADGIKSAVRTAVIGDVARKAVVYSNTNCYRGLVPIEEIRAAGVVTDLLRRPVCFVGLDKHLILFPIKKGTVINVVAFTTDRSSPMGTKPRPDDEPWVVSVSQEELLHEYKD
ncbi:hypothetical protein EIP91_011564 [Steccherinum ochraceum]|uniref:FAD-binding domain-containing protein n=1 Tax=Steccherinum ochraceum TaxID=92696 RepID=A0A4R0RIA9_9APHY|nr:hypothetical protein EIP91_011564 [Steccherinum ochraceum]